MLSAPNLLDPAVEELKQADATAGRSAVETARAARELLGERFSSVNFMYVLMRAFEVDFYAARDAGRWHECEQGPRALSDTDLEVVLAPWFSAR